MTHAACDLQTASRRKELTMNTIESLEPEHLGQYATEANARTVAALHLKGMAEYGPGELRRALRDVGDAK